MTIDQFSRSEEAFRRFVRHRTMLKACVLAVVRDPVLAEDVLSDAAVEIARGWERYDRRRPFAPWARGVTRNVALAALRKRGSEPVVLAGETLEAVGAEIDEQGDEARLDEQKEALRACLERLPDTQRRMLRLRYEQQHTFVQIAEALGRTLNSIYVTFSSVHRALLDCVRSKTGAAS